MPRIRTQTVPPADTPSGHGAARTIKIAGLELPIPLWTAPAFGIIAVLYVGYTLLNGPIEAVYSRYSLGLSEETDQQEAYKHFWEKPAAELQNAADKGTLEAKLYSDGCVSVAWRALAGTVGPPHFIRKVMEQIGGPAPGPAADAGELPLETAGFAPDLRTLQTLLSEASAQAPGQIGRPAAGSCRNPHPGSFTTSYGTRNGCWVQTFRKFSDGCMHYQWFNTCSNYWDTNADGSPKVYWTECRH